MTPLSLARWCFLASVLSLGGLAAYRCYLVVGILGWM